MITCFNRRKYSLARALDTLTANESRVTSHWSRIKTTGNNSHFYFRKPLRNFQSITPAKAGVQ